MQSNINCRYKEEEGAASVLLVKSSKDAENQDLVACRMVGIILG